MKTLNNPIGINSQTVKKYVAVLAVASLASFTSLASLAVFADTADTEKKTADAAPHYKHRGDVDGKRGDRHRGWNNDRSHFGAKLDLTDAQKESLKAARAANESSSKDLHEKLRAAHDALDKAAATNTDDAMLSKLATDLASVIAQKELAQAKARRDFVNLLTPEQKQKLAAFEAEHKKAPHWKNKPQGESKAK